MLELAPRHKRGLVLDGPLMNASGTLGFAGESRGLVDFSGLGAFVTNALTAHARSGANPPNVAPLPRGLLIHTGLPNPGVRAAVRRYGRAWRASDRPVIAHLAATTPRDVRWSVEILETVEGLAAVELGLRDEVGPAEAAECVRAARGGLPLLARLPLVDAEALAQVAAAAGADALVVAAPPRGSARVGEQRVTGRLYGPEHFAPALAALRAVVALAPGVPVVGAGGIYEPEAARAMLAAGAVAVQVDAVVWGDPDALARIAATL